MPDNLLPLIWFFPIAFILHDFEELILFEPWLKRHAPLIRALVEKRAPRFVQQQIGVILEKTSPQFAVPIGLIFLLTVLVTFLLTSFSIAAPFYLASSLYFLHGFLHIGQALVLRRYIPALLTSIVVVLPYGALLFWNVLAARLLTIPELLSYFGFAALLAAPFILVMHVLGDAVYKVVIKLALR